MSNIEKESLKNRIAQQNLKDLKGGELEKTWAEVVLANDDELMNLFCAQFPAGNVDEIIELIQSAKVNKIINIDSEVIKLFEEKYGTYYLSELVEWANEEYEDQKAYIKTVEKELIKAKLNKVFDLIDGEWNPDMYTVDEELDSLFNINYDNGAFLEKAVDLVWNRQNTNKCRKETSAIALVETLAKEDFDFARCNPKYVFLLIRLADCTDYDCDDCKLKYLWSKEIEKMFDFIQEKGYDINAKDNIGKNLLDAALRSGFHELVKYLVERGSQFDSRVYVGKNYYGILTNLGIEVNRFKKVNRHVFEYVEEDGMMLIPAFNGDKEELEYLNENIRSNNYHLFEKAYDEMKNVVKKKVEKYGPNSDEAIHCYINSDVMEFMKLSDCNNGGFQKLKLE